MAAAGVLDEVDEVTLDGGDVASVRFGRVIDLPAREPRRADPSTSLPSRAPEIMRRATKRTVDVVASSVLLIVLAPLLLVVVLIIQLESPGTPFYRARRSGYRGRPLEVLKFRKMHLDACGLPLTVVGDPRLTRVGAFMARTRIDEIPQLWNVLRGHMSLVGPRPEDPQFVALHEDRYEKILSVRPGITGWSQLAFANESQILDRLDPIGHYVGTILPAKVHLDCKYAERTRLASDFATLMWTVGAMLLRAQVAVHRETGRLGRRRRPRARQLVRPTAASVPAAEPATAESR